MKTLNIRDIPDQTDKQLDALTDGHIFSTRKQVVIHAINDLYRRTFDELYDEAQMIDIDQLEKTLATLREISDVWKTIPTTRELEEINELLPTSDELERLPTKTQLEELHEMMPTDEELDRFHALSH